MSALEVMLPHGPGFQFIDEIVSLNVEERVAVVRWTYTGDEPGAKDHFPGQPLCPGVWMEESANQGLIQIGQRIPEFEGSIFRLLGSDRTRFRAPVTPGSVIETTVTITQLKPSRRVGKGNAVCRVNGEVVAEIEGILFDAAPPERAAESKQVAAAGTETG